MPPVPGFRCLTLDLRVQKKTITGGFPGAREPAARKPAHSPEADGRAGRGARRTRSGRAFPFAPVRAGASIIPSDIQLDISAFLAVPPQNYGTDVQFQMPPVHAVFPTAALELSPATASTSCPRARSSRAMSGISISSSKSLTAGQRSARQPTLPPLCRGA